MSLPKIETKEGKSRLVEIHDDYVIKLPLNTDIDDIDELYESLVLALNGNFETAKEIFFWKTVQKYAFLKDYFAKILDYDLNKMTIKAEKLNPVDEEYFYKKFFSVYSKFYFSKYFLGPYLDNHTIDNSLNYGFDDTGRLKLLDYSFVTDYILKLYDLKLESIKTKEDLLNLEIKMFDDVLKNNNGLSQDLQTRLTAFVVTLKYHNNMPLFYYYSYKFKLLSFKEIWKAIWSK